MILTYNFSDDDTRSSFEALGENLGFVEAEDQSTYVLPYVIQKQSKVWFKLECEDALKNALKRAKLIIYK